MNLPEFMENLLEGGKPKVLLAYDGEEPEEVEFDSMGLSICLDGHLHGIVIGDAAAVRDTKENLESLDNEGSHVDGATRVVAIDPAQAAQFIEALSSATSEDEVLQLIDSMGIADDAIAGLREAAMREMERLSEKLPAAMQEHTAKLKVMLADPSTSPDELMKMHLRLFMDPRIIRAGKEAGLINGFDEYDTLLEAHLDGKDISRFAGHELIDERPDLVEQLLDELEAEGVE